MRHAIAWWRKWKEKEVPIAPVASEITSTGARLDWSTVFNAKSYTLQRSLESPIAWTEVFTGLALSYVDTSLTADTRYLYRLRAVVFEDNTAWSPYTLVISAPVPILPGNPTVAPIVIDITATTAYLELTEVADASSYRLQRSANGTSGWTTVVDPAPLFVTDTGPLTPSTSYWYRYLGVNTDGPSATPSPSVQITTDATSSIPGTPPTVPVATGTDTDSTVLSWAAVSGATYYVVRQGTTSTGPWTTIYNGPLLTDVADNLSPGTAYWFNYAAGNTAGLSAYSGNKNITTATGPSGNVRPYSAFKFRSMAGVAGHWHSNFWPEYSNNLTEVMDKVEELGVTTIRGQAVPGLAISDNIAAQCVARGIKWVMAQGAMDTATGAANRVKAIANNANYRDCCLAIEGLNEPNEAGVDIHGFPNWQTWAATIQKALWDTAKAQTNRINSVEIVSSALHQLQVTQSNGAHWLRLQEALAAQPGTGYPFFNKAGLHTYPKGEKPDNQLDLRISWIKAAFGNNVDIRCTEFGYTTRGVPPGSLGGAGNETTLKAQGIYGPRAYLQFIIDRDTELAWYEVLDDVDSTSGQTDIQSHYGMVRTPGGDASTWINKPVVASVGALLNTLKETDGTTTDYTPNLVTLNVNNGGDSTIRHYTTATHAQSVASPARASVWLFKDVNVTDSGNTDDDITITPTTVTYTDRLGARTVSVGADVVRVDLR